MRTPDDPARRNREPLYFSKKISYSENRRRADKAASYNVKYEEQFHKRVSNRRERRLLEEILDEVGRQERILDVPCGAGRLSDVLSQYGEKVCEVDYSFEMVKLCRHNARNYTPLPAAASAFDLPFRNETFGLVASIRLSHHIPDRAGRVAHLKELLRVSHRFVLVTFFEEASLKNRMRNLKRRFVPSTRQKLTLKQAEVADVAREAGFVIRTARPLSRVFSGHTFALLERKPG